MQKQLQVHRIHGQRGPKPHYSYQWIRMPRFSEKRIGGLIVALFRLGALTSLAFLGACASVWTDTEGHRHIVGLMHLKLPPTQPPAAAETLRIRTFGLSWTNAAVGSALLLGYGDTTFGFVRENVCVALDATQLEAPQ